MKLFALDSSGKTAGVAIYTETGFLYTTTLAAGFVHSEKLLPLCKSAFSATGLSPRDIDVFAVAAGPGSFTGLRIGLATIKGLAFEKDTPVAALSTLEAMAMAPHSSVFDTETTGTLVPLLDARAGRFFTASFQRQGEQNVRLSKDAILTEAELQQHLSTLPRSLTLLGDTAGKGIAEQAGAVFYEPAVADTVLGVAKAGWRRAMTGDTVPASETRPIYMQRSQAERLREQALAQEAAHKTKEE